MNVCRSFDLAEESLQEAFATALTAWARDGVPRNPGAWLTTVAHRKLLDVVRREKTRSEKQTELEYETERLQPEGAELVALEGQLKDQVDSPNGYSENYPDERLRLIFTCCHPSLNQESQVALTLRTRAGNYRRDCASFFVARTDSGPNW